jgi:2-succinyl-5-enolpyruvyl-6-hydroxy-3-cyclohexene-1-carboxylate synthase
MSAEARAADTHGDQALTDWSRVVARTLVDAGIRTLIASPGSRSTPFLIACLREPLLQVHHVLDERSAAFVALGAARVMGDPIAVLATSGTAPAHWYPAIIEASLASIPLVFLSADRPTEQGFCGAAQTIDQTHLFGRHVRFFADPGNPEGTPTALLGLRRQLAHAISHARGPVPGPVHLNLRARKPLEPKTTSSPALDSALAQPLPKTRVHLAEDAENLAAAGDLLSQASRPLFVLGPLAPTEDTQALLQLVQQSGALLAAESTSQLRFVHEKEGVSRFDSLDGWLRAGLFEAHPDLEPDLIVQCGAEPTSAAYERWVTRRKPIRIVLGTYTWNDPSASARVILRGPLGDMSRALQASLKTHVKREAWTQAMAARHARVVDALALSSEPWSEAAIARITLQSMPNQARLVLGNSLPIRMVDRYAHAANSIEVVHQRGANGIDGFLAQAFGAVLAAPRKTVVLLGDCTFLHDASSLLTLRRATTPVVIVIVQNGGGRIFETLPVARAAPETLPYFVTEEEVDLASLAGGYGVHYARAEEGAQLAKAIARGLETQGVSIVEAIVEAHGAPKLDALSDAIFRAHTSAP